MPVGPLLENFASGEIARQLTWAEEPAQLFHDRDRDKVEADTILEHASGHVVGIEVKAAETVGRDDVRGLRHLATRLDDRFHAGYVLYAAASNPRPSGTGSRPCRWPHSGPWAQDGQVAEPGS